MMNHPSPNRPLRIGAWYVDPAALQLSRDGETQRVEVRTMRLLQCLAERSGEVVSIDELIDRAWSGVVVTQDSVYQAIASLRRMLGDDPKRPTYIETVPRLGYRLIAPVSPWVEEGIDLAAASPALAAGESQRAVVTKLGDVDPRRTRTLLTAGAALGIALLAVFLFFISRISDDTEAALPVAADASQKSVAVLVFLDLTEEMDQEYFGDRMTEDLIDKLSKTPGLRVPPPRSSFSFKGKPATVGEIAAALGVAYVLDGSLRESGSALRVTARLIRADGEFIVWSQSYDRPLDDLPMIHDDIAHHVIEALQSH
jgi:transcriptional activator of cad operon